MTLNCQRHLFDIPDDLDDEDEDPFEFFLDKFLKLFLDDSLLYLLGYVRRVF